MDISLHTTLTGHQNPIYTLAVDTASDTLYSAGNDKGIVEWDLTASAFRRILCNVPSSVYVLHHINGTNLLAAGMRSGDIYIIDTTTQTRKAHLTVEKGAVFAIKILHSKNELIAIGEEGKAYVWDLKDFQLLYSFRVSLTTVRTIEIDKEEQRIAFGDKNGVVYLYQASDYHIVIQRQIHQAAISSMLFFGDILLTGGRDAKLFELNLIDLTIKQQITPHMFTVYGICALDAHHISTISRDKTIKIWNDQLKLQKNISRDRAIDTHFLSINSQAYHPEMHLLATAGDDKMIKVWSIS